MVHYSVYHIASGIAKLDEAKMKMIEFKTSPKNIKDIPRWFWDTDIFINNVPVFKLIVLLNIIFWILVLNLT